MLAGLARLPGCQFGTLAYKFAIEHVAKALHDSRLSITHANRPAGGPRERRHAAAGDSTRNDEIEIFKVGGDVERKSVACDPSRNTDTDGAQLVGAHPRARESFHASGAHAEVAGGANHHILQVAYIFVHVAAIGPQIENGITDELAGTVIRDVAAAPRFMDLDAALVEDVRRGEQVRFRCVQFHAERDDVRMFQQQEKIGHGAGAPLLDQRALQLHGVRVWHHAEPADF